MTVSGGSYYNYYRDYDPTTGRYIQSDPIGLYGGLNTYGYVRSNPQNYADPLGLYDPLANDNCIGPGCGSVNSPGSDRRGQIGVFGCLGVCASSVGGGATQVSVEATYGAGLSFCIPPIKPQEEGSSCDGSVSGGGCGVYDPNCDNSTGGSFHPSGRFGIGFSMTTTPDGGLCFNLGPHAGLPITLPVMPTLNLGDINE